MRAAPDALAFQERADAAIREGQGYYGAYRLLASTWFELCRLLLGLLRRAALGRLPGLTAMLLASGVEAEHLVAPATGLALELLPAGERTFLLAGVQRLLDAGPDQLRHAALASGLSSAILHDRRLPVPSCIAEVLRALPGSGRAPAERRLTTGPRSRVAVMRRWARLERKWRVDAW